jgi:hypothetical protein
MPYPNIATVAVGRLNGWECQRITSRDGVLYLIERADRKLHEAPQIIHAKIDAAVDGVKAPPNFKCMYCGWVGAVNPGDPACGNSRCVEPYPGKSAAGVETSLEDQQENA